MTATTSSKQPGPDPQSTYRDPAHQPERPGTIPWELLGASDYRTALTDLGSWLAWLVPTYRIPPSVIPPCWFLHAGLIEELGHLWTAWGVTRHPESAVGMVGLEWDGHRERATGRLRELVATAGCNGTNHSPKPGPLLNRDDRLWADTLRIQMDVRITKWTQRAVMSTAEEILLKAERRKDLAMDILSDIADDPSHPTDGEIIQSAIVLENSTRTAATAARQRSQQARAHLAIITCEALCISELALARDDLLATIAKGCAPEEVDDAARRWVAAATNAAPTGETLILAAAANLGRSATANHRASVKSRYHGIAGSDSTPTA